MEAKKETHWYAFYVRMHHEKKTAEKLEMLKVVHFLPIQEVIRQWSDRKKKIKQVVIPMLIFICTDEKGRIELLQNLPSLTGCLIDPATRRPAIIRNEEMEKFKFMLDFSDETIRFQSEPLAPGEKVEVIKGSLKGLQGELVELEDHSQVMIRIEHLGYATVEIPVGYVKNYRKEQQDKKRREIATYNFPPFFYWKNTSSRRVLFSSSISVNLSLQGSKSPGISNVSSGEYPNVLSA